MGKQRWAEPGGDLECRASLSVLFVDDEPRVLEGLERMLFDVGDDLAIETAAGGDEALERLARSAYDVVITDMRMPRMDGAELLARVAERYPHIIRVILSGQTDEDAMLRAVRVAHRFLSKPCSAEALYEVIRRAERVVARLPGSDLRARIAPLELLRSPPSVHAELMDALRRDDASCDAVSAIVGRDPALAARVLHLANSALFSRVTCPIADVRQAMLRLGTRALRCLALDGAFQCAEAGASGVERTQQRSQRAAEIAFALAGSSSQRDEAFTAALLHDIGSVALRRTDDVERSHDRVRASLIGGHILDLWGLPPSIVEAVLKHATPDAITVRGSFVAAVTHVASALAHGSDPSATLVDAYDLSSTVTELQRAQERAAC